MPPLPCFHKYVGQIIVQKAAVSDKKNFLDPWANPRGVFPTTPVILFKVFIFYLYHHYLSHTIRIISLNTFLNTSILILSNRYLSFETLVRKIFYQRALISPMPKISSDGAKLCDLLYSDLRPLSKPRPWMSRYSLLLIP